MVSRQSAPPASAIRCGLAEPSVSAPTSEPTSSARSALAQPTAIFMPTG